MSAAEAGAGATPAGEHPEEVVTKRKLIGRVVSDKMTKTVVVEVTRFKREAMYKKYIRVRKRYKAHDEKDEYKTEEKKAEEKKKKKRFLIF